MGEAIYRVPALCECFLDNALNIAMEEGLSPQEARSVADALFKIDWSDGERGWMECPGKSQHTKPDGPRDCNIMLAGGKPPTIHCLHASCGGPVEDANFALRSALGKAEFLKKKDGKTWVPDRDWKPEPRREAVPPPEYDADKLRAFAGDLISVVDAAWLANRSPLDPSVCSSNEFLNALYHPGRGEKVLVFTNEHSQGEYVWPCPELPDRGREGVWFLAQPVSGEYLPNPRSKPVGLPSRRIMECVRSWRYMLLESDEAPARLWLAAVVQLPLRIAAIYTSGSRSVHVLVRVDAPTRDAWDKEKAALLRGMVTLGACRGSLSSVRLSRLPGCLRIGKKKAQMDAEGNPIVDENGRAKMAYEKFPTPGVQKLLYLASSPDARAIASMVPRRDVITSLKARAVEMSRTIGKVTLDDLRAFESRASHFSSISDECAALAKDAAIMAAELNRRTK